MPAGREIIPRSGTLPEEVARRLRERIEGGELKPGAQLPTQQELSAAYGVSRPVVREAISLLKSEGLVTAQQGRGQFVNADGNRVFRLTPDLTDAKDLILLLEFLMSVESAAAALAAERHSPKELAAIRAALDDLGAAITRGEPGADEDMRFHQAILKAAHNHYFDKFGEFLENQVRRLIRAARSNTARLGGLTLEVHKEHVAIYEAIAAGDKDGAAAAASVHLVNACARLKQYQGKGARSAKS
ncbi:FadR/GntR family transcriptional regulator [Segnochrobactraceae bacterium EtOH-i3]